MQYLRNQWLDFKNSWSYLIPILLWIQRYTTYPPHINYTTTLPGKTITMKITIFHSWFFDNARIITTNSPDLNPLDYHVWGAMLQCYKTFQSNQIPLMSWRKSCKQYGMIYHRTPSTRPHWPLSKDIELVWKLEVDYYRFSQHRDHLQWRLVLGYYS